MGRAMQILLTNKAEKFLAKQYKGDPHGIHLVRLFIDTHLQESPNPTTLPNCAKLQGRYKSMGNLWRWRVGKYRIIGDVKSRQLTLEIIEITTRENAY